MNYLYNGVELPDINEVWTDKTYYPFALISRPLDQKYYLNFFSKQPYRKDGTYIHATPSDYTVYSEYVYEGGTWVERFSGASKDPDKRVAYGVVWSSFDILNADGTTYFSASEPVDPNAPTFDKASFLAGLACGLCERGR